MARRNWNRPRGELIETGVQLCRSGWLAGRTHEVARILTSAHYLGKSRTRAARCLARDIGALFYARHGGLTEDQEIYVDMANALRDEGWKPFFDEHEGCFWLHEETGCSVNNLGGFFPGFEIATKVTYESPLRAALLKREVER